MLFQTVNFAVDGINSTVRKLNAWGSLISAQRVIQIRTAEIALIGGVAVGGI
jgi:hypothetical protein